MDKDFFEVRHFTCCQSPDLDVSSQQSNHCVTKMPIVEESGEAVLFFGEINNFILDLQCLQAIEVDVLLGVNVD